MAASVPASGQLDIFERVEDLPAIWNSVAATGGLGLDARYLRSLQHNAVDGGARRYIVHRVASGAVVIAVAELLQRASARNPVASVLLGRLNRFVPPTSGWWPSMLLLRADLSSDAPYAVLASPTADRAAALNQMMAALEARTSTLGWSLALDCVPVADRDMTQVLASRGYLRTMGRPHASLQIDWGSWDGYLASAGRRSGQAARNIRHEEKRSRRDGVEIVDWLATGVPEGELFGLLELHEQRLNGRAHPLRAGFLGDLCRTLGRDVRVLLCVRGRELQGLVVVAMSGSRGYVLYPGFVAPTDRAGFSYFNLTYYEPIRLALRHGLRSLAFGNAAFAAKIRRGCAAHETALFFRPRSRIWRAALRAPVAMHCRLLRRKYATILGAEPFTALARNTHASPAHQRAP